MNTTIKPTSKLSGSIQLPASKSYSVRAYIIASCGGESTIVNPSVCDDALIARNIARQLGATIVKKSQNKYVLKANRRVVANNFDVSESGTTLRFLLPLAALKSNIATIKGKKTLVGRPNKFLTSVIRRMGVDIRGEGSKESVPIRIRGGNLESGKIQIDGSLSSQFISALLITTPMLENDTTLLLKGKKIVSTDYIKMTMQVLSASGVHVKKVTPRKYEIKGRQEFKGLKLFEVPADYGLAAFPMAAAALTHSNITLKGNLSRKFVQADGHIVDLLRRMGVKFSLTNQRIKVKGPFDLKGGTFSLKDCPDLVPIVSVLALFAKGRTKLTNIAHVRTKESDRISDLRRELIKIGAKVSETHNDLIINPQNEYKSNCLLNSYNDHRLAMAFAVLGIRVGVRVRNIQCCSKSYPSFVSDMKKLGVKLLNS